MTEIDDLPKLVLKESLGYPVMPYAKLPLTEYQKGVTQRASQKLVKDLSVAAAGIRTLSPLDSAGSAEE